MAHHEAGELRARDPETYVKRSRQSMVDHCAGLVAFADKGAEVFIIASPDTVLTRPVTELMAEFFPGVPWRREVGPHESLFATDKARRLLGYQPRYTWRPAT